jgi:glycosyltransferase involved in cell wall biosynthesis
LDLLVDPSSTLLEQDMTDPDYSPVWSVMIPTYNPRPDHLEQALRSVLVQDPGPDRMQIEVMDDCSTGVDVAELVKRIAGERIAFYRNAENLGLARNWNRCIDRSNGTWIHILHQDDYVLPGFYEQLEQTQSAHPEVSLVAARSFFVDRDGYIEGATPRVRSLENGGNDVQSFYYQNPIQCPGVVVRKSFYEQHGQFRTDLSYALDWELWARIIGNCGGAITPHILACYRASGVNATSGLIRSAEASDDEWHLNRIFKQRYRDFDLKRADRGVCRGALLRAESLGQCGEYSAASANLKFWKEHAPIILRVERSFRNITGKALRQV